MPDDQQAKPVGRLRRGVRRGLRVLLVLIVVVGAYLLLWPTGVHPLAWTPGVNPAGSGIYASNALLASVEAYETFSHVGPEDVAVAEDGGVFVGMRDGTIMHFNLPGVVPSAFAHTGGRPLGLDFDPAGHLVIADAIKGLLRMDVEKRTFETLTTQCDGVPFKFTDDVDVAGDGTIYFTDASSKRGLDEYTADFLEQRGYGRLLKYDPTTQKTTMLMDGLNFANGVALSPDEDFVLVVETARYCIHRYWLNGPDAGTSEIFVDNLPGFPDGVSCNGTDRFWVALVSPRSALLDKAHRHPFEKKIIARLPRFVQPKAKAHGWVLGLDLDGNVVESMEDPSGQAFSYVTSVEEKDGWLYLGSLELGKFGRIRRP